jgi:hypothetical protein
MWAAFTVRASDEWQNREAAEDRAQSQYSLLVSESGASIETI